MIGVGVGIRLTGPSILGGVGVVAPTNLEANAQAFNLRTQYSLSVVADNIADPDGGTTADTLTSTATGAQSATEAAITFAAGDYTSSIYIPKAAGTAGFAHIQINRPNGALSYCMNKATGAIGAELLGGVSLISAQVVDHSASYWRLVVVYTATAGGGFSYFGPCDAINSRSVTVGASIGAWQSQTIAGNFPTGGGRAV